MKDSIRKIKVANKIKLRETKEDQGETERLGVTKQTIATKELKNI